MATTTKLAGTSEAAQILGVELPRITRWRKKGWMPPPVCELAASPVWRVDDLVAWRKRLDKGKSGPWTRQAPKPLKLMGTAEAADFLAVNKSQIGRWRRSGKFPEPHVTIVAGPIWTEQAIVAFARRRSREEEVRRDKRQLAEA